MALVKTVSADSKNNSLELNEFIKMIARDIKRDATGSRDELLEAFRLHQFYDIFRIPQMLIENMPTGRVDDLFCNSKKK